MVAFLLLNNTIMVVDNQWMFVWLLHRSVTHPFKSGLLIVVIFIAPMSSAQATTNDAPKPRHNQVNVQRISSQRILVANCLRPGCFTSQIARRIGEVDRAYQTKFLSCNKILGEAGDRSEPSSPIPYQPSSAS